MSDAYTSLKLERPDQKPRVFRFDDDEVRIGFSPACHLALEPFEEGGAEAAIHSSASKPARISPGPGSSEFALNGVALSGETLLKAGDVLTANSCRIVVQSVPGPPAESAESGFDEMPTVASPQYVDPPKETAPEPREPKSPPLPNPRSRRQRRLRKRNPRKRKLPKRASTFFTCFSSRSRST